jgi:uncharacterized protein YndB with AHSA1/START domain
MSDRPVGLTRDAGWEIGVSRTLPASVRAIWDLLVSPTGLAVWLGRGLASLPEVGASYTLADGTSGELRSLRPLDRIRLSWQPPGRERPATVQVALVGSPKGCSVRFHAEHLADAEDRERMREHWRAVLDELAARLGGNRSSA